MSDISYLLERIESMLIPYSRNIDEEARYDHFAPPAIVVRCNPPKHEYINMHAYDSNVVATLLCEALSDNGMTLSDTIGICVSDIGDTSAWKSEIASGYAKVLGAQSDVPSAFIALDASFVEREMLSEVVEKHDNVFVAYDDSNEDNLFHVTRSGRISYSGQVPGFIRDIARVWSNLAFHEKYVAICAQSMSKLSPAFTRKSFCRELLNQLGDESIQTVDALARRITSALTFEKAVFESMDYDEKAERERFSHLYADFKWFVDNVNFSALPDIEFEDPFAYDSYIVSATALIWESELSKICASIDIQTLLSDPTSIQKMGMENGIDFLMESVLAGVPIEDIL